MRVKPNQNAFTIVELLIVIVVIGMLAAITIVAYSGIQNRAIVASIQSDVEQAVKQIEIYNTTQGTYPSNLSAINVKTSSGNSIVYQYNYDQSGNSYCVAVVNGSTVYGATNSNTTSNANSGCATQDGIVAWWRMNGNANDSSSSGMNGATGGSPLVVAGQNGQTGGAYQFNGTSDYISLSSSAPLNFTTQDFTVTAWVKLSTLSAASGWNDILSSTVSNDWSVGVSQPTATATGYIRMTKNSFVDAIQGPEVTQNAWHFLTYVYSAQTIKYYIDGSLVTSGSFTQTFTSSTKIIGARNAHNSGYFRGAIDDLRVYNRILSSNEIVAMDGLNAQ